MAKIQPARINLSSKANEIIATMQEEIPISMYHFRKQYGGSRKYAKYEDELLDKALIEKQMQITPINEYISKVGNRWMSYTTVDYYPKAQYANATHFSFIYYETYGSCGAFFPLYSPQSMNKTKKKDSMPTGVMIFTSHFFQRMSERTGKAYRSRELIQEFVSTKSTHSSQTDEDGEVIVKFKGGYGFGVEKSASPRVIEIRTYLTDNQLSSNQRKKVERIDAYAELISDGMFLKDVALSTAYHNEEKDLIEDGQRRLEALRKLGLESQVNFLWGIHLAFVCILGEILKMQLTTAQSSLICQYEMECGLEDMIKKYANYNAEIATEEENNQFMAESIDLYCKVAKRMKLKSVNRETITECINKHISNSKD